MWGSLKSSVMAGMASALVLAGAAQAEDRFVVERSGDSSGPYGVLRTRGWPRQARDVGRGGGGAGRQRRRTRLHAGRVCRCACHKRMRASFIEGAAEALAGYIAQGGYTDVSVVGVIHWAGRWPCKWRRARRRP